MVWSMLDYEKLSSTFWAKALIVAAYTKNRSIRKEMSSDTMPYEILIGSKHELSNSGSFRGKSSCKVVDHKMKTLKDFVQDAVSLGYAHDDLVYELWDIKKKTQWFPGMRCVIKQPSMIEAAT